MSSIKCCINGKNLNFLLVTGASLCAIKHECLKEANIIYKENIEVTGIEEQVNSINFDKS